MKQLGVYFGTAHPGVDYEECSEGAPLVWTECCSTALWLSLACWLFIITNMSQKEGSVHPFPPERPPSSTPSNRCSGVKTLSVFHLLPPSYRRALHWLGANGPDALGSALVCGLDVDWDRTPDSSPEGGVPHFLFEAFWERQ